MNRPILLLITITTTLFFCANSFSNTTNTPYKQEKQTISFVETAQTLTTAKLKEIPSIINSLTVFNDQALPLFEALINSQLYYIKDSKQLIIAKKNADKSYATTNIFKPEQAINRSKKLIKKIRTNNKIRSLLRTAIARIQLFNSDPTIRENAANSIVTTLNKETAVLFEKASKTETNKKVLKIINLGLTIYQLNSSDQQQQLDAISSISGNLHPLVRNTLQQLIDTSDSPQINAAATHALIKIEQKTTLYYYLEKIFFGLSLGSVLLLAASGLAITFGVMGVINMAHGEMIMLGAYTTYVIQLLMPNHIEYSLFVAIPAAFLVSALVGIIIERGVIQFLKGRPLETLLATFGISLLLQQLVRSIFSPLNRQVLSPEFMTGALEINPIFSITYNRLYILFFALLVFLILQLILKKTSLGLNVRAVSQNRNMAKSMGIRTEWVDALTFGLGSGIAGIAGVALSQITNVGPNLGQAYIIDSFMVVVFGGVGNLWGTLVGAFSLGIFNKFIEPVTGAVLANIIVLVGIIIFIQKRPRGLFPQKGRAAES